jgi:hypothetical protein
MTSLHNDPPDNAEVTTETTTGTQSDTGAAATGLERFYPIGTPGQPWTDLERNEWKATVRWQRSYRTEVVDVLMTDPTISELFDVEKYGELSVDPEQYPLYLAKSKTSWKADPEGGGEETEQQRRLPGRPPSLLVTGGVHGYETSGVQGALLFLQSGAVREYISRGVNVLVAPCVSPWAYEHIQRWNADLLDPNRSFKAGAETEESRSLMEYLTMTLGGDHTFTVQIDLHETTDTDATEFMPAKHAAAGLPYEGETIPDGFYLVGDCDNPQLDFQTAVIDAVRRVTHIAPPDEHGNIIDFPVRGEGVIVVPATELGLCCSLSGATYVTTTEVYPDSPRVTPAQCNQAQVAAITGAMDYALSHFQTGSSEAEE